MKKNFKQLSEKEISLFVEELGGKTYRARQIINWIYGKLAASFDEMTDLPIEFREELDRTAYLSNPVLLGKEISTDGSQKFLFSLEDGETIESVLLPNTKGEGKFTLCISSQAGCAMRCGFCVTGGLRLKRNLKAYEIADQLISVKRNLMGPSSVAGKEASLPSITNIVFMGMGEPLNNFDEVVNALRTFTGNMGFSKRKITVSTCGIVPKIYELAEKAAGVNLAVSLNATTDETRNKIMPINKKYPLKEVMKACRKFPLQPGRQITFEYVLLDGTNDSKEDAARLARLLRGIRSKVNLITYNPPCPAPPETYQFKKPSGTKVLEFQDILRKAGITTLIRKSMGADISAACGQLKASYQ
ncbi:MAG: 23S rRNA (adenine(2503)-C(2))-methyltransferase RlmN [Nitrospiraceae bacterium]|nr:MAG: 23S rRNA (adenine(2503)-C(2))-methyltransferase RlmN [Nitrospiraceae bacterium]